MNICKLKKCVGNISFLSNILVKRKSSKEAYLLYTIEKKEKLSVYYKRKRSSHKLVQLYYDNGLYIDD